VSDKEQAETDVKPSVKKNHAARQQSNPELESSSDCASSPPSNRRSPYYQTNQRALKDCITNRNACKYEKGSYDEEPKQSMASNFARSYSFFAAQFKTCCTPVIKERREDTLAYDDAKAPRLRQSISIKRSRPYVKYQRAGSPISRARTPTSPPKEPTISQWKRR